MEMNVSDVEKKLRFVPLGGLGEIGMNCFALEQDGEILVVDCGAAFPDDDLGVDIIHPDFSWLKERSSDIVGIFITHGHEDHIGALFYLLRELQKKVPVYAPPHASALIKSRFSDLGASLDNLHEVRGGVVQQVGSFLVEPIPVAHSIVDAYALSIETVVGRVVHTGDFNLDQEQPAGHLTDSYRLKELGKAGVRLLLSDSTNIDRESRQYNEGDVARFLIEMVQGFEGRVVVGMFSSNGHRLWALGEAAQQSGRKLCFLGRSLTRHHQLATRLGHLRFPSSLLVDPSEIQEIHREKLLVVAGGSQGEGASSLRRLSAGKHPQLKMDRGDKVCLSSRVIPGNEMAVFHMMNGFLRQGVEVQSHRSNAQIHTSGHASRDELTEMIEWLQPQAFIPVHGTLHHLLAHEKLARELGVADTCVVENGASVEISSSKELRRADRVRHGLVRVAFGGKVLSNACRRERGDMARGGALVVSVAVNEQGVSLGPAQVTAMGVPGLEDQKTIEAMKAIVDQVLQERRGSPSQLLSDALRRALRHRLNQISGARSVIVVHLQARDN